MRHIEEHWDRPDWDELPREDLDMGSGRGLMTRLEHPKGALMVRTYRRGGALRGILPTHFFRPSRAAHELAMHQAVFKAGVPTCEPVGWECDGRTLHQMRYITVEIPEARALPRWLRAGGDVSAIAEQVQAILKQLHGCGIFHVDLNLNNWLVVDGKLYLIDFDKAKRVNWSWAKFLAKAEARMARSSRKLGLPILPLTPRNAA